ncbi:hypothetical protein [Yersinia phage vB_YenM_P778]
MALYTSKAAITLGTRGQLVDFILAEKASPNGYSRKSVELTAEPTGLKVGIFVKADGTPTATLTTSNANTVAGISLVEYSSVTGLCTNGEIYSTYLARDAEVKSSIFAMNGITDAAIITAITTQLATLDIDVVKAGL